MHHLSLSVSLCIYIRNVDWMFQALYPLCNTAYPHSPTIKVIFGPSLNNQSEAVSRDTDRSVGAHQPWYRWYNQTITRITEHLLYIFWQYCLIPSDHQLLHVLVCLDFLHIQHLLLSCPVCDSSEVCGVKLKRLTSPPPKETESFSFCFLAFYLKYKLVDISRSFKACLLFSPPLLRVLLAVLTGFSTLVCCLYQVLPAEGALLYRQPEKHQIFWNYESCCDVCVISGSEKCSFLCRITQYK